MALLNSHSRNNDNNGPNIPATLPLYLLRNEQLALKQFNTLSNVYRTVDRFNFEFSNPAQTPCLYQQQG